MFDTVFYEVSVLLFIAAIVGFVGIIFRQPLIVSFILVGILAGPSVFGITRVSEHMDLLATLGISLLLFIVGLKLDLNLIRTTGKVALMTGLGQVLFTSVVGYWLCLALGLSPLASLYVAIALTFSSTIIIVKLLSDKGEIESLHGRIALGFLIVQDLVVVLLMIGLSAVGVLGEATNLVHTILDVIIKGALLLLFIFLFIRFVAERLLRQLARTQELIFLFVIAWAVMLASITDILGFSKELGALLAGVSLASTTYRNVLASRLANIRDFLLLFFFINLGARIHIGVFNGQLFQAFVLSLFVLIGNPLIVLAIMGWMGYRKRTSFLAGLTVAQISEFSLVFVALGLSLGHVAPEIVSLVTLVGLITIGISTYMILYSHLLYDRIAPFLSVFERRNTFREQQEPVKTPKPYEVIIIGLGRYGSHIGRKLLQQDISVLGIDYDPEVVSHADLFEFPIYYGDATNPSLFDLIPLQQTRCIIITLPTPRNYLIDIDPHMTIIHTLHEKGFSGAIVLTARTVTDLHRFESINADLILYPYADAAEQATERIQELIRSR